MDLWQTVGGHLDRMDGGGRDHGWAERVRVALARPAPCTDAQVSSKAGCRETIARDPSTSLCFATQEQLLEPRRELASEGAIRGEFVNVWSRPGPLLQSKQRHRFFG